MRGRAGPPQLQPSVCIRSYLAHTQKRNNNRAAAARTYFTTRRGKKTKPFAPEKTLKGAFKGRQCAGLQIFRSRAAVPRSNLVDFPINSLCLKPIKSSGARAAIIMTHFQSILIRGLQWSWRLFVLSPTPPPTHTHLDTHTHTHRERHKHNNVCLYCFSGERHHFQAEIMFSPAEYLPRTLICVCKSVCVSKCVRDGLRGNIRF